MQYPKVMLKKRKYMAKGYYSEEIEEFDTYVFRDKKFEEFMYNVARAMRFAEPRGAKKVIDNTFKHLYWAKRKTEDNVVVIDVNFHDPDYYRRNDGECVEWDLNFTFMPVPNIVHVSASRYGSWHGVIYKGKMVMLNYCDYRQLVQFYPTKWNPTEKDSRTVKFAEMFDLYCQYNKTVSIPED